MAQPEVARSSATPRTSSMFAASVRLLRARPVVSVALGAAVGFSLLSVCCGLGLFTAPWFLCELSAMQLALCTERPIARGPAFLVASWLLFWAVLLVSSVFAISLLASSSSGAAFSFDSLDAALRSGSIAALVGSACAWLLITPLLYAPLIALEQQASSELALVESARLMVSAGRLLSARLGLSMFVLEHAPLALAAVLVSVDPARAALWFLCAVPLMCVCVPLGQGMLVSAYAQTRSWAPKVVSRGLPASDRRWVRVWALLIVLPIVSLVVLGLSLSRTSRVAQGTAPEGEELLTIDPRARAGEAELAGTTLTLQASTSQVSVVASDGGGVGVLPLKAADPIERVKVVRVRDSFAIEVLQGGRSYLTVIDRAGVRRDDGLRARLRDRSRPWQWLYLLTTLLLTGVLSVSILYDFGRLQLQTQATDTDPSPAVDLRARVLRRARSWALLLAPFGVGCLAMALLALFAA